MTRYLSLSLGQCRLNMSSVVLKWPDRQALETVTASPVLIFRDNRSVANLR